MGNQGWLDREGRCCFAYRLSTASKPFFMQPHAVALAMMTIFLV